MRASQPKGVGNPISSRLMSQPQLERKLGVVSATALVVSNMIGVGREAGREVGGRGTGCGRVRPEPSPSLAVVFVLLS